MTIPRRAPFAQTGRSLVTIASMGSLACAGPSTGALGALLHNNALPTGANAAWLEKVLPSWDPRQPTDLYAQGIQSLRSVAGNLGDARMPCPDRDALLKIKGVLSLTGQQLADAMGVSRTALYQWLDESTTMRDKYRTRLDALKGIADFWSQKSARSLARSPGIGGRDRNRLAKLLASKKSRSIQEARELLETLAAAIPVSSPGHRSVLDIIKEQGWNELPEHVRRSEMRSRIPTAAPNFDQD